MGLVAKRPLLVAFRLSPFVPRNIQPFGLVRGTGFAVQGHVWRNFFTSGRDVFHRDGFAGLAVLGIHVGHRLGLVAEFPLRLTLDFFKRVPRQCQTFRGVIVPHVSVQDDVVSQTLAVFILILDRDRLGLDRVLGVHVGHRLGLVAKFTLRGALNFLKGVAGKFQLFRDVMIPHDPFKDDVVVQRFSVLILVLDRHRLGFGRQFIGLGDLEDAVLILP